MSGGILLGLRFLLAVALYAFLGWALLSMWRDLKYQREILASRQAPSIGLRVDHAGEVTTSRYRNREITIGRDPACECSLNSEKVSANHARLSFSQNQWWIEDLKSTNGSFLNDEALTTPTVVVEGDLLRCGDVLITIMLGAE
jgi:hypothetical protein